MKVKVKVKVRTVDCGYLPAPTNHHGLATVFRHFANNEVNLNCLRYTRATINYRYNDRVMERASLPSSLLSPLSPPTPPARRAGRPSHSRRRDAHAPPSSGRARSASRSARHTQSSTRPFSPQFPLSTWHMAYSSTAITPTILLLNEHTNTLEKSFFPPLGSLFGGPVRRPGCSRQSPSQRPPFSSQKHARPTASLTLHNAAAVFVPACRCRRFWRATARHPHC